MQIVCPHCATVYDVPAGALTSAGRKVRCARCQETWQAVPAAEPLVAGGAGATFDSAPAVGSVPAADRRAPPETAPLHVDSPPLAAEMPPDPAPAVTIDATPGVARIAPEATAAPIGAPLRRRVAGKRAHLRLPGAVAALGALCIGLIVWRADVVRLMPQTALFFKTIGLGVNLRALDFAGVSTALETVNGTAMLTIEGEIVARRQVEVPRLRFSLRDAAGTELHAWNATIEQASLEAGERAHFRSLLAAPPADGREIAVRFFNRRDINGRDSTAGKK